MSQDITRIAIVNLDKCKPKKCKQECKRNCPVVRIGKLCVEVSSDSKSSLISESLCIGCGICTKKCPLEAISIINLPTNLNRDTTHRYGANQFKIHRLPTPRPNEVLGLVGCNGTGKSTALKILSGKLVPNLGKYEDAQLEWDEIIKYFRGSELQNYFKRLSEGDLKTIIKPQYVDSLPKIAPNKTVGEILNSKNQKHNLDRIIQELDLECLMNKYVDKLSGGELQRFAIALTCIQEVDVCMFDEPSSYLDVKQRLNAAKTIRDIVDNEDKQKYVIVVEHDLSVLDYLSDSICCLYGQPGAYGVVTLPFGVREGINVFLSGYIPTENMRFREFDLNFKITDNAVEQQQIRQEYTEYPVMKKSLDNFTLDICQGNFCKSEIIVLLGENGTGKTTMIKMLAGVLKADNNVDVPMLNISYKPQKLSPKFAGTVRELLFQKLKDLWMHPQFMSDVVRPMSVESLLDQQVKTLSGGELQRVALVLCLGKPADIYLIDEPSAYLDSEQRMIASKVIKRFILHTKRTAFIVEHDFIMSTYLADRVILFEGTPSLHCKANSPQSLLTGMNKFLKSLEITFRRDPTSHRPRINKYKSVMDREQKENGTYFYMDDN